MAKPIDGSDIFNALKDEKTIIMAVNVRMPTGVAEGILRAAKDSDSPIMFELAKSESNLEGGYTKMTPEIYSKRIRETAEKVDYDIFCIHGDHIGVKKGDDAEIEDVKKLVEEQIKQGYTSFAIDASHIFNFEGKDEAEELAGNIQATIKVANFIKEKYGNEKFGLEVEVGEIGREDANGRILTTPEQAVTYISELNKAGINPQILAIANGSAHGNTYKDGVLVEQVSIDIEQTKKIVQALKDNNLHVRIAQHGITGTPRDLIASKFPHGDILKGNVGTFWQNLVLDIYKVYEPELYQDMWNWTMENYKEKNPGRSDEEIIGKCIKNSIKVFYDKINNVSEDTKKAIEAKAYTEALIFFKAFNSYGMAQKVRDYKGGNDL